MTEELQPGQCPICLKIESDPVENTFGVDSYYDDMHCANCGHNWTEQYVYAGPVNCGFTHSRLELLFLVQTYEKLVVYASGYHLSEKDFKEEWTKLVASFPKAHRIKWYSGYVGQSGMLIYLAEEDTAPDQK